MEKKLLINDASVVAFLCGPNDTHIKFFEKHFKVSMRLTAEGLSIKGKKEDVLGAVAAVKKIEDLIGQGLKLDSQDISAFVLDRSVSLNQPVLRSQAGEDSGICVASSRKKYVFPKTSGQNIYIESMKNYDIVFSTGPAGTGKTYLAMAMAVHCLLSKKVGRIILTRPAIEAGESLGFLPGDMHDKLGPYLRPLYDALYDMIEAGAIENYLETGVIEIVPLAYMRGRTLNNAFVILDEAQNCTAEQLRMFLTRLGFDSKTVITGDTTQSDLPAGKPAGLLEAMSILKHIKGIEFVSLSKSDTVRHPLIQNIIQAYENHYCQKTN